MKRKILLIIIVFLASCSNTKNAFYTKEQWKPKADYNYFKLDYNNHK